MAEDVIVADAGVSVEGGKGEAMHPQAVCGFANRIEELICAHRLDHFAKTIVKR
jgi:hypothetical protein